MIENKYKLNDLAKLIDHTNLKAFATKNDLQQLCEEAIEYGFACVMVNPVHTEFCKKILLQHKNHQVKLGVTIGFPLGQNTIATKYYEAKEAINNGAEEIDYVINLSEVMDDNYDYIIKEMTTLNQLAIDNNTYCKVIFENCYLAKDEIKTLAEIATEIKPAFIKTSTGFGSGGATEEDVKLMKKIIQNSTVKVKAAGGISDAETFIRMINAGADRIGASAGIKIIQQLKASAEKWNIKI